MTNSIDKSTDTVGAEASAAVDAAKTQAADVAAEAKRIGVKSAEAQMEKGKAVAEDQLSTLSGAVDEAAAKLSSDGHPLASYAGELSIQLDRLSSVIENSTLDEVASSAHRLARKNPGLFMLGGVALGFAASRFIRATDERHSQNNRDFDSHGEQSGYPVSAGYVGQSAGTHPYRRNEQNRDVLPVSSNSDSSTSKRS